MDMTTRRFRDAYGTDAVLDTRPDGLTRLRMSGKRWPIDQRWDRVYRSYRGARIAMGRMGDGWREVTEK